MRKIGPAFPVKFRSEIAIDFGPEVADLIGLTRPEALNGAAMEVGVTFGLPARLQ